MRLIASDIVRAIVIDSYLSSDVPEIWILLLFGSEVGRTWDAETKVIQNRSKMVPKSDEHVVKIDQKSSTFVVGGSLGPSLAHF